ncbi:TetR/AcrR family transcriptional regulator [Streptococcus loxodontisalivarius]|uniref:AcrR family transcriptional regulator n=1 Tax=Streptococcus loxodontisalivarius TaxID=1349415 RepID=A0ABS2PSG9_9STRE|nr:TetR/AcrR family transcriptional regulator [Streptococcus loxodontisalivarius]MBM7642987.1 AcrR family transcriptional regulator [Streptococcus loxodontisalivarius]
MAESAQDRLKQALLTLLDDNEFDQLSVSQICKEAGVHRSTFYNNYDSQFDLLEDTKDYLIQLYLDTYPDYQAQLNAPKEKGSLLDSYYLTPYLQFIKDHQRIYRIYLKNPLDFHHALNDQDHFENHFIQGFHKQGITDEKRIRYMVNFYLTGIRKIIFDWVSEGCQEDIDFIVSIIHELIY